MPCTGSANPKLWGKLKFYFILQSRQMGSRGLRCTAFVLNIIKNNCIIKITARSSQQGVQQYNRNMNLSRDYNQQYPP